MHIKTVVLSGLLIATPFLVSAETAKSRFYLDSKFEYLFMDSGPRLNSGNSYPYGDHTFKNTPATSIVAGWSLSSNHAFEFEATYFKTETNRSSYYVPSALYADPTAKLQAVPLLIGYKNTSQLTENWSLYFGISAGVTLQKVSTTRTFLGQTIPGFGTSPSATWTDSHTSGAFTYGTEVGVGYNVNARSKITTGLKFMNMNSGNDTTRGTITALTLGYKFSF